MSIKCVHIPKAAVQLSEISRGMSWAGAGVDCLLAGDADPHIPGHYLAADGVAEGRARHALSASTYAPANNARMEIPVLNDSSSPMPTSPLRLMKLN